MSENREIFEKNETPPTHVIIQKLMNAAKSHGQARVTKALTTAFDNQDQT